MNYYKAEFSNGSTGYLMAENPLTAVSLIKARWPKEHIDRIQKITTWASGELAYQEITKNDC